MVLLALIKVWYWIACKIIIGDAQAIPYRRIHIYGYPGLDYKFYFKFLIYDKENSI